MKVGVDAVLLGTWAGLDPIDILEVGEGCGVISLILAQRFPRAKIKGIDIDQNSVEEAEYNFKESPWSERLESKIEKFPEETLAVGKRYDLIVSNPPYFASGITNPLTPREKARHQDSLSAFSLLENADLLLTERGRLSIITPSEFYDKIIERSKLKGYKLLRECRVKDKEGRPEKRVMLEFSFVGDTGEQEHITLFDKGVPTPQYRKMCKDLYLKF